MKKLNTNYTDFYINFILVKPSIVFEKSIFLAVLLSIDHINNAIDRSYSSVFHFP